MMKTMMKVRIITMTVKNMIDCETLRNIYLPNRALT